MPSREERVHGALLGVHAGDSLGATLEFKSWGTIRRDYPEGLRDIIGGGAFRWKAGHATDDTDLTRALLLGYYDAAQDKTGTADIVKLVANHMLKWEDGDWPDRILGRGPADIGNATSAGLDTWRRTGGKQGGAGIGQAGNGSLMRCIPTALFVHDRSKRIEHSQAISAITHDDPRCAIACAAYNEMVAALLDEKPPSEAVEIGLKVAEELNPAVAQAIQVGQTLKPADLAEHGPKENLSGGGYVLDSLTLAVAAVLDPRPPADVLVDICRFGSDTDTNAAIAGGLLGTRDGVNALPNRWLEKLQFRDEFVRLSHALLGSSVSS